MAATSERTTPDGDDNGMLRVSTLQELARLVEQSDQPYFIRFSAGPAADRRQRSTDYESGLELPGLSVHPLDPQPWWTRPLTDWLARQLCSYSHLADDDRFGWILCGRVTARGPDNEPILVDWAPVARLEDSALREAASVYESNFSRERDSR